MTLLELQIQIHSMWSEVSIHESHYHNNTFHVTHRHREILDEIRTMISLLGFEPYEEKRGYVFKLEGSYTSGNWRSYFYKQTK